MQSTLIKKKIEFQLFKISFIFSDKSFVRWNDLIIMIVIIFLIYRPYHLLLKE